MVKLDLAGRWCGRAARPLGKREVWVAARFHVTRRTTIQSFRRRQAHLLVAAREKVGFDDLTIHDLRHVAASAWIAQDLDVAYVSALLGHANPSITLGAYAHLFDATKHADRAREAMDNRVRRRT